MVAAWMAPRRSGPRSSSYVIFAEAEKEKIKRLNHANFPSGDVGADRAMFETYFGLQAVVRRGDAFALLRDADDFRLVINNIPKRTGDFTYPADDDVHHIGFRLDTREQVDVVQAHLEADGWPVQKPYDLHGAWTFYLKAAGGYTVEVYHQHRTF